MTEYLAKFWIECVSPPLLTGYLAVGSPCWTETNHFQVWLYYHRKNCCEALIWTCVYCNLQSYPGLTTMYFWCLYRVEIWSSSPQCQDSPTFSSEAVVHITKRKFFLIKEPATNTFVIGHCFLQSIWAVAGNTELDPKWFAQGACLANLMDICNQMLILGLHYFYEFFQIFQ